MKKKSSRGVEPPKAPALNVRQLELPLAIRASAAVVAFPMELRAQQVKKDRGDASERLLAFAAQLPDW